MCTHIQGTKLTHTSVCEREDVCLNQTQKGYAAMTIIHQFPTRLQEQSRDVNDIQWNTEEHSISIKGVTVALTATEYRLFYPLRYGTPITYSDLTLFAYNCEFDKKVLVMVDKHIDRIRRKLRKTDFYIYCVLGYGYLLLPRVSEESLLQASLAKRIDE